VLFRTPLLVSLLLLGMAGVAAADDDADPPKWGEAGAWEIFVDTRYGNRCYATTGSLGAAMLVSLRPDGDLDFVIDHESWRFAEEGKTYRLKFVFGNGTTYEEELEGVALESAVVLRSQMSPAFLSDFMQRTILLVYHQESEIGLVLLLDTHEVVGRLRTCDASASSVISPAGPSVW
jgi:hypothetical protein